MHFALFYHKERVLHISRTQRGIPLAFVVFTSTFPHPKCTLQRCDVLHLSAALLSFADGFPRSHTTCTHALLHAHYL